jgi:prepilin-type processing-associated H-X9-DG protein
MFDIPGYPSRKWESEISFNQIPDGLGVTILAGEKHVPAEAVARQGSMYNGDNQNNCARVAGRYAPLANSAADVTVCRDTGSCKNCICDNFGSWHIGVCQFVFGDGHVSPIATTISLRILEQLAERADGGPITGNF